MLDEQRNALQRTRQSIVGEKQETEGLIAKQRETIKGLTKELEEAKAKLVHAEENKVIDYLMEQNGILKGQKAELETRVTQLERESVPDIRPRLRTVPTIL